MTANVSGGHLNPAVTLCAVGTGYLPAAKGVVYIVAQILGAVLASLVQVSLLELHSTGQDRPFSISK